jgi:hypothetical protein
MWRRIPDIPAFQLTMAATTVAQGKFVEFMHVVLLLVQQLQGATPQLRGAILHSPAGTTLLGILSDMTLADKAHQYGVETLVQEAHSAAAAAAATGWQNCMPDGRELVELLLLPGLLSAPVPGVALSAPPAPTASRDVVMYLHGEWSP